MLIKDVVRNAKGEQILLSTQEQRVAEYWTRKVADALKIFRNSRGEAVANAFGYEISITTLTTIMKKISEQKFFEIAPADYLPVRVGEGSWSAQLTTYRSFELADEFETGIVNTGGNNSRLATADAGVDALNIQVFNWAKSIGWSIFDLELAAKSGNWDLVAAKEESRKKNFDLGIQRIAFLGAQGQNGSSGNCLGLFNQPSCTINTSVITKKISSMSTAELKTFTRLVVEAYRDNCNRTAWPTHFVIPESDFNGLASQASPDFPIKSTLQLLEETFRTITRKADFKILPCAYGDASYHSDVTSLVGKQCYALLNYDEKSLRMDVPVQYTNTLANSLDNFSFQNVGYAQFTGVLAYRPLELLYFQY